MVKIANYDNSNRRKDQYVEIDFKRQRVEKQLIRRVSRKTINTKHELGDLAKPANRKHSNQIEVSNDER